MKETLDADDLSMKSCIAPVLIKSQKNFLEKLQNIWDEVHKSKHALYIPFIHLASSSKRGSVKFMFSVHCSVSHNLFIVLQQDNETNFV